ncbi:hypothetical protein [Xylocopilactobacillus apicola]|uniref:DUF4367 domain-containing protein n=1 Tax=Xylocopilactobacillus apicola TaxID=2932184 RepID=A0AAU9CYW7_9LACO|nr:hypothetical protein [Xylocopilactobacillus apicola]BDR59204.1 hypothetical protein XA3_16450 [Xylocopilactobacillus apicola]
MTSVKHEFPLTKLTDQQLELYLKELDQPFTIDDQKRIEANLQKKKHPKRVMKVNTWLILTAALLLLVVGGGLFAARELQKVPVKSSAPAKYSIVLKQAKKDGEKQAKELQQVPKENYFKGAETYAFSYENFSDMNQKSSATVQGVVTNWTKVPGAKNSSVTILSIYVHQVLTDKSKDLAGKTIYVYQRGGFNKRGDMLDGRPNTLTPAQSNEEVFYEQTDFPVARIGTELVVNLNKITPNNLPQGAKVFDPGKSYALGFDEQSMWIKNSTGQYEPVSKSDQSVDKAITNQINELIQKNLR